MNENKRRQILKRATIACLLLIFFVFLYVIFQGLLWSPNLSKEESYQNLLIGETRLIRHQNQRYWVTKLSDMQRKQLSQLTKFVHIKSGCALSQKVCELDASSQRPGVLIQFVIQRPVQLTNEMLWFGGFVDPANSNVYDLLGRGYIDLVDDKLKALNQR